MEAAGAGGPGEQHPQGGAAGRGDQDGEETEVQGGEELQGEEGQGAEEAEQGEGAAAAQAQAGGNTGETEAGEILTDT